MPIERGEDWGWPSDSDGPFPVLDGDVSLAQAIANEVAVVRLTNGDVARTLGIANTQQLRHSGWHVPIDALQVTLDDQAPIIAAAHVVVGTWVSPHGWTAVLNAAFIGTRNWAPRAHPGDGRADIVTVRVKGSDRYKARRRAITGSHVPHPAINIRRTDKATLEFDSARPVSIDGAAAGRIRRVHFEVVSNAIVIAI